MVYESKCDVCSRLWKKYQRTILGYEQAAVDLRNRMLAGADADELQLTIEDLNRASEAKTLARSTVLRHSGIHANEAMLLDGLRELQHA